MGENHNSIGLKMLLENLLLTILTGLVFHSIQYRNGWLATSHLFDMFTQ